MDFFTVPTVTFRVLYCFFVISHSRRRILHFNATEHPTAQWIVQQLREIFPEDQAPKYLVLDRDRKFSREVTTMLECLGSELIRTAHCTPWQNGVAERWVGSCRRELLDHVIVLSEPHLRRLVQVISGIREAPHRLRKGSLLRAILVMELCLLTHLKRWASGREGDFSGPIRFDGASQLQIVGGKGISSKPLARQALRPFVGCLPRANWVRSDTLARIGGSRYDSGRYDGLRPQA
jgi:transposase InsO family protein